MNYIDPTGHFLGSLFAWVGKVVIGGVVNAVVDTGVRLLTGQEVSLKTIGSSFVEGCVASAVGTGTAKLASKATSVAGKYAINKAGGAAARTAVGVIRGDSAKDIAKSVGVGFLADNVLDGVSSKISKIRTERANAKALSTANGPSHNSANYSKLKEYYRQAEKYGKGGTKSIQNSKYRFYGNINPAKVKGEMAGRRLVREWNYKTGRTRTWHETLDHAGRIRIVTIPLRKDSCC